MCKPLTKISLPGFVCFLDLDPVAATVDVVVVPAVETNGVGAGVEIGRGEVGVGKRDLRRKVSVVLMVQHHLVLWCFNVNVCKKCLMYTNFKCHTFKSRLVNLILHIIY